MKLLPGILVCLTLSISFIDRVEAQQPTNPPQWWTDAYETLDNRMQWWEESRFALFMHWGAYSVLGGEYKGETLEGQYSEHIARILKIPKVDYITYAASQFRPEKFDAEEWVRLAKNAGMKYVVITAKHHDGFAIFHSKHSYFDVEDIAHWDRDPLMELSQACKKHGLKFGVYYSHAQDWYEPYNVVNDWDFDNPTKNNWYKFETPHMLIHKENMEKYYIDKKSIPQVLELIEDYGVDLIWFDTAVWIPMELRMKVLKAAREAKADLVISPRVTGMEDGLYGDYLGGPDNLVVSPVHENRYWEQIVSTVHSWGYNKYDQYNRRPAEYLLKQLATTVSKGGNMMLNIGPKGDGTFPDADVETLEYFAEWMKDYSESIHGAFRSPLPKQNWGVVTSKGDVLYLHVFDWPENGELRLAGLKTNAKSAELMKDGTKVKTKKLKNNILLINVPEKPLHETNTVIKLTCKGQPEGDGFRLLESELQNWLHVLEYTEFEGGLKAARGKPEDAYVYMWKDPEASISWELRLVETQKYNVQIIYDVPKSGSFGGKYKVKAGDQVLTGTVNKTGTGNQDYIADEKKRMSMSEDFYQKMRTEMIIDDLGEIELTPGTITLELGAEEITGSELFRPRALLITPL